MTGDLLATLRRWESLKAERDRLDVELGEAALVLERLAAAANGDGSYARLIGQDDDGRLRFFVRGGERTFALGQLEELGGA